MNGINLQILPQELFRETLEYFQGWFRVILNDEVVMETTDYSGYGAYRDSDADISLLNEIGLYGAHPTHGAVSDVNIWRRVLTGEELQAWAECRLTRAASLLSWETVSLATREVLPTPESPINSNLNK